jgi:hypothetical protein
MHDLDKEGELLERAGLAAAGSSDEAPAAVSQRGAEIDRGQDEPTILLAKGHGSPVGGDLGAAAIPYRRCRRRASAPRHRRDGNRSRASDCGRADPI